MFKHLIDADGETFSSNLPTECFDCMYSCSHSSQLITCYIDGKKKRTGSQSSVKGGVFLCSTDHVKSSKQFKTVLGVYFDILSEIVLIKDDQAAKKSAQLRRLTHNLISYNAHILQDLYSIVSQDKLTNSGRSQVSAFSEALRKNPEPSAISLLRILKNSTLTKTEFSIFEKLYESNPDLDFYPHKIHKVVLLVLNSFRYDFIQNKVRINVQPCTESLCFDYDSTSAALAHIIDNAVKYTAPNTELAINFFKNGNTFVIEFEMISIKIDPDELYAIYEEGHSGRHTITAGLSGKGIGMNIVKKVLKLNDASVEIIIPQNTSDGFSIGNTPYQRNTVKVIFFNTDRR